MKRRPAGRRAAAHRGVRWTGDDYVALVFGALAVAAFVFAASLARYGWWL